MTIKRFTFALSLLIATMTGMIIGGFIVFFTWQPVARQVKETYSVNTLLYESPEGTPLRLTPTAGGQEILPGTPRWYIPAKVQPLIYGDPHGVQFFYWDPKTHKAEGPFPPGLAHVQ